MSPAIGQTARIGLGSVEVTRAGECAGARSGHTSWMRVHVPVGVIEDTDGYLHAAEQRSSGPIALCGGGHIRERWGEDFDTDDPRSCPICVAILSG